jgi:FkbM family methyltransferase
MTEARLFDRAFTAYARGPDHPAKLRIIGWIVRWLGERRVRAQCAFGCFDLDLRDLIQSKIFFNGAFEPLTLNRVLGLLEPGDCFVDVGANIGQFAIAAGNRLRGSGRVIAVEPNPPICGELLRNRAINGLDGTVSIVSAAISDARRMVAFGVPERENRGTSREVTGPFPDSFHLFTASLREICRGLGITAIKAMKVDVEGAELSVLRSLLEGGPDLRPEHIVLEYLPKHFAYAGLAGELLSYLDQQGYDLLTVEGEPYRAEAALPESNLWARRRAS